MALTVASSKSNSYAAEKKKKNNRRPLGLRKFGTDPASAGTRHDSCGIPRSPGFQQTCGENGGFNGKTIGKP